jgi:acyl carrier protein
VEPSDEPIDQFAVLRAELPLSAPYVPPRTVIEAKLAEIFRVALSMDRVGVDDSYDELGGDSVLAAVIFTQIEESFGIAVPMRLLVSAPTITRLAVEINRIVAEAQD